MLTRTTDLSSLRSMLQNSSLGDEIYSLIRELYPICRSITGEGFRQTLGRVRKEIPLEVHEVPSGTQVFDWTVPKEWNIRDAYVKNSRGERIIDFKRHNLHVVNYSVPVHRKMSLAELRAHLHTLADQPDWIPYRTSYYKESWGFCLSHNQLQTLREDEYEVCIDTTLESGSLTYGECYLPGESSAEVLISCHACHPSLCNDNLSGLAIATFLAKYLGEAELRYSYRHNGGNCSLDFDFTAVGEPFDCHDPTQNPLLNESTFAGLGDQWTNGHYDVFVRDRELGATETADISLIKRAVEEMRRSIAL